jgi:ATP-dependent Clp protease adapter protein ClpS
MSNGPSRGINTLLYDRIAMTTAAFRPRLVASVRASVDRPGVGVHLATERVAPDTDVEDVTESAVAPPWMTILHNCECHTFEQVVRQLQKAIACTEAKGWEIAWQVHNTGKAVVKVGPEAECVRVGNILASIGLVVTVVQS